MITSHARGSQGDAHAAGVRQGTTQWCGRRPSPAGLIPHMVCIAARQRIPHGVPR